MRNKSLYLLLSVSLIIGSCSEEELIEPDPNTEQEQEETNEETHDCSTVVVSDLSTHVVIEQTGTWCSSCAGEKDEIMEGVNHSPRVHHMAVHGGDDPFANDRTMDFRSAVIRSSFYPTLMGTIDPAWIDNLLDAAPKAQIGLEVTKVGDLLKIEAKVEILGDFDASVENGCAVFVDGQQVNVIDNKNLNIGLYLVEDGLDFNQAAYGPFTHNNVMRDYITLRAQGDAITSLGEAVSIGDSFCEYYEYDLSTNSYHSDIANCKILALIVVGNKCEMSDTQWYLNFLGSDVVEIGGL